MPKVATQWRPTDSGTVTSDNSGFSYLLESGGHILTESGFDYLLEDNIVGYKSPTLWSPANKPTTSWRPKDGLGSLISSPGDIRITQSGDIRITELGDIRIEEGSTLIDKNPTQWTNN